MATRTPTTFDLVARIDSIMAAQGLSYVVGEHIYVLEELAERYQSVDFANTKIAIVQFCADAWEEVPPRWVPDDDPVLIDGLLHVCSNFPTDECRVFADDGIITAVLVDYDLQDALAFADLLMESITTLAVAPPFTTLSIGIATTDEERFLPQILREATKRLYDSLEVGNAISYSRGCRWRPTGPGDTEVAVGQSATN